VTQARAASVPPGALMVGTWLLTTPISPEASQEGTLADAASHEVRFRDSRTVSPPSEP
jgi:hypothetical protein